MADQQKTEILNFITKRFSSWDCLRAVDYEASWFDLDDQDQPEDIIVGKFHQLQTEEVKKLDQTMVDYLISSINLIRAKKLKLCDKEGMVDSTADGFLLHQGSVIFTHPR